MEALGEPSWPFGLPCWPPWAPSWQPKTLQTAPGARPEPSANACAVSNSVRLDFSSFFYAMVERPNLNFRQPVQLQTGGKPSTWFPPGGLVELFFVFWCLGFFLLVLGS